MALHLFLSVVSKNMGKENVWHMYRGTKLKGRLLSHYQSSCCETYSQGWLTHTGEFDSKCLGVGNEPEGLSFNHSATLRWTLPQYTPSSGGTNVHHLRQAFGHAQQTYSRLGRHYLKPSEEE